MSQSHSLIVKQFVDRIFGENAYVVYSKGGAECWIIDPSFPPQPERMLAYVREQGLEVSAVVLTHAHADHIAGLPSVLAAYPAAPVIIAREEQSALLDPNENLSQLSGFAVAVEVKHDQLRDLPPGSTLSLGALEFQVLDTSGHSPGGRTLYCPSAGVAFVGDALFAGSIGRTDFHHSNHQDLIAHIKHNLLTLPGETTIFSGHGPSTTILDEKEGNPFL